MKDVKVFYYQACLSTFCELSPKSSRQDFGGGAIITPVLQMRLRLREVSSQADVTELVCVGHGIGTHVLSSASAEFLTTKPHGLALTSLSQDFTPRNAC